jgi:4'-phosphopantetheinyl transferase
MRAVEGSMRSAGDEPSSISRSGTHPGTIDIWRTPLALPPDELSRVSCCLDDEEQQRVARLRFQRDRDRFLASRGLLRHILASYLDRSPGGIRFGYAAQGKPFLLEHPDLHFNLSHAADVMVVAVAPGRELGVDVEMVFSEAVMNEVSGTVLSSPERVALEGLDPAERREWFVRLWTRKEAYIKADGHGMALRLDHIDVTTLPGRVRLRGESPEDWFRSPRWAVRAIPVGPGYSAALAGEGFDWQFTCADWPSDAR